MSEASVIEVHISDLKKIESVLHEAYMHHLHRDEMNSRIHMAKKCIESPLTVALKNSWERIDRLINRELVAVVQSEDRG